MKRITAYLTAIILLCTVFFTAIPANAAVVDYINSGDEEIPAVSDKLEDSDLSEGSLPSSYSSRDLGYCTSVKSQIGSICWAYASTSSYETLQLKYHFFTDDLNISALDLWGTMEENGEGWQRSEREAGYTYIPIGYFTSWGGPVTVAEDSTPKYGVTQLRFLSKDRRDEIKRAIMDDGAVTANLNLYSRAYSSDSCSYCLTDEISRMDGHTVSVVGWDDNYSTENFSGSNYMPKNDGAWLCKNSWGDNNNIGGYLWISYEDHYLFNSEYLAPSFAVDKVRTIGEDDSIYQNEKYGATYELNIEEGDVTDYFSVFDFSQQGNVIDSIVFESKSIGADYRIYYVPVDDEGVPASERSRWTQISSGKVEYEGYIEADVEAFKASKSKAAIAVEIDTTEVNSDSSSPKVENALGVTEWLRNRSTKKMIFVHTAQRGNCFVSTQNGIVDLKDYYLSEYEDELGGTLVIKAITSGTEETSLSGDVNLDGVVDINDVTLIQKYIAALTLNLSDDQLSNADFNRDGVININDATAIQKHIALIEE